jgi:uncharacterized protein YqgC (DUF456 family)
MTPEAWTLIVGLLMVAGLAGTILPVIPDLELIWLTGLGYGLLVGWGDLGPWLLGLMALIALGGSLLELALMGFGARLGGGSWIAIAVGLAAGLVAMVVGGPVAGLLALPLAIFLVEWRRTRQANVAGRAVLGSALGYALTFVVRLASALTMIALWGLWVYSNNVA